MNSQYSMMGKWMSSGALTRMAGGRIALRPVLWGSVEDEVSQFAPIAVETSPQNSWPGRGRAAGRSHV